ncbi:copper resistance protein CopC [Pusillimonas sp. T2]|uniref:copper resistance CopC/CopD family protein n=1 Tax=Pusillimonas sp. T2 TaxID=1548123 RepID=UPI001303EBEC|nr:copper resistance protein CopC [Pusillimonas sp. T2]
MTFWLWLCVALYSSQSMAHAFLISTQPEDNAQLDTPPATIVLQFNEPLTTAKLELRNEAGEIVMADVSSKTNGGSLELPLPNVLERGIYRAHYRVTSGDGHLVAGQIQFGVGVKPTLSAAAPSGDNLESWSAGIRAIHYLALFTGLGGGLFLVLMGSLTDRGTREALASRLVFVCLMAVGTGLLLTGLTGASLQGGYWANLIAKEAWSTGSQTQVALSVQLVVLAVSLTLAGLVVQATRAGSGLLVFGVLIAALSFAVTSHVGDLSSRAFGRVLLFLHVGAVTFWIGALWPLAFLLQASKSLSVAQRVLSRFSRVAPFVVALLLVTGVAMSVLQGIASQEAIMETSYGGLWRLKVFSVLALLSIALWNRLVLAPLVQKGRAQAFSRLRRTIVIEIAVAAVVVSLSAGFSLTPPPRTSLEAVALESVPERVSGYSTMASNTGWTGLVDIQPARVGNNDIEVILSSTRGELKPAKLVSEWQLSGRPDATVSSVSAVHSDGIKAHVFLPDAGRWQVVLRWQAPDGTLESMTLIIPVAAND